MTAQFDFRRATTADAHTLTAFNTEIARETENKELEPTVISAGVRRLLDDEREGFYLIADASNEIAGSLMVTTEWSDWRNGFFWWIQSVYVRPAYRRQGVYAGLYAEVKALAAEREDIWGFRLYVEASNEGARRAYEALGMTKTHYRLYEEQA